MLPQKESTLLYFWGIKSIIEQKLKKAKGKNIYLLSEECILKGIYTLRLKMRKS